MARFSAAGVLDPSFGTGGFATASFGADGPATAYSVAIDSEGSIVVAGKANGEFAVARFTNSGLLDPTFNPGGADDSAFSNGGQRTIPAAGTGTAVTAVLVEGNSQIVGVGAVAPPWPHSKLNFRTAAPTPAFGNAGLATISQLTTLHSQRIWPLRPAVISW